MGLGRRLRGGISQPAPSLWKAPFLNELIPIVFVTYGRSWVPYWRSPRPRGSKEKAARFGHQWHSSPSKMRLFSSLLTLCLLHSLGFASGHWEPGLDGDQHGEIPRPTPDPLLYQDKFAHGPILMEIRLGSQGNRTSPRDLALGARQVCNPPGAQG